MIDMSTPRLIDLPSNEDNITDWCLDRFRSHYSEGSITKDGIWEYLYGVMHAPDWRERYRHDLQRNLPRIPLAPDFPDFEAFRSAGRRLMDLHVSYETIPEWPLVCLVDGRPDDGAAKPDVYRITRNKKMKWGKAEDGRTEDRSVFMINDRCKIVGIPNEAHEYRVSGRSPLEWAIASLRWKTDNRSEIVDDPNGWHVWVDEPFNLIRHLRRLVRISVETTRIVNSLPNSLSDETGTVQSEI